MSVEQADSQMLHIYPLFAAALKKILAQATVETTGKHGVDRFFLVEGYRSQARQNWLYSQGRTRPGSIVTYKHISNHTGGMAGDCYPVDASGQIMWEPHPSIWDQFAHCVRSQPGMQSGHDYPKITGGTFVDSPHVEPNAATRAKWAAAAHAYLSGLGLI